MSSGSVVRTVRNGVGTLTLNRPERLNAFDADMLRELAHGVRAMSEADAVRAIVLTGAGRGFCAGADLGRLSEAPARVDEDAAQTLVLLGADVIQLLHDAPKPVLASINGPAAGGGAGLALACDLRIASEGASLGLVFHRLGLHPDLGTSWSVPRLAGTSAALELFWNPGMVPAERCRELGLVNRVVPGDRLEEETAAWASQLAALPRMAARLAKQAVQAGASGSLAESLAMEARHCLECFRSADAAEGLAAYGAKRAPVFNGR